MTTQKTAAKSQTSTAKAASVSVPALGADAPKGPILPVWSCEFATAPGGVALDAWTVGAKYLMKCHGDIPVDWQSGGPPPVLQFPREDESYSLAILEAPQMANQSVEFVVTGYKAGKHQPEYIRFVQGERGFEVSRPAWNIQSVLKPNEKPQPFPPFGPFMVSLPHWVLLAIAIVILLLLWAVIRGVRRARQRRRMRDELQRHRTVLSPLHQFYRDSRVLRRRLNSAKTSEELKAIGTDLEREFRLYVLRRFEVPALEWSPASILVELRRRRRKVWTRAGEPLRKTLTELKRLNSRPAAALTDLEQLHRMSLDAVERLDQAESETSR